jgi:glutathione S-transferase
MPETSPVTLYVMPGACSLASHIALVWAGREYTIAQVTHETVHDEPFLAINSKGAVPALVLADGTVITESLAILQYIADCAPDAHLGATAGNALERAMLNECLADLVSDVHKAWAPFFAPSRFVTNSDYEDDVRQAAFAQIDRQYKRLNDKMSGREWALFNRRTIADAYVYVMCSLKDKTPQPLANYPVLAAYKARMDKDPGVMRAQSEELIAY